MAIGDQPVLRIPQRPAWIPILLQVATNGLAGFARIDVNQAKLHSPRMEDLMETADFRPKPIRDRAVGPDEQDNGDWELRLSPEVKRSAVLVKQSYQRLL